MAVRAAAKKAVGPEPPAQAEAKSGDDGAAGKAKPKEAVSPEQQMMEIFREVQDGKVSAVDVAGEASGIVGDLVAATAEAEATAKQSDEQLRLLKDQYRRLQADFDNFRSRADQEKSNSGAAAKARVLEQLLPVIDNFEIAGKSIKTETDGEIKINESYQSLYRQTVDIFRNLGLEAVATVGAPFDPEVHDGIMREENDDVPDGQVLEEFRKGFKYKEQLLRPAMVKVAVSTSPPPPPAEGGEDVDQPAEKSDKPE